MKLVGNQTAARRTLLLLVLAFVHACAWSTPATLQARYPDVAPWAVSNEKGKPGIHAELLNELALRAGLSINARAMVYARLPVQLGFREVDIAVALDSAPMDQAGRKIGELMPISTVAVGTKPFPSLKSLAGKSVAIVRGTWYGGGIDTDTSFKKHEVTNINQGVRMVSRGHVDAVVGTSLAIAYAIYICGEDPKRFAPPLVVNRGNFAVYVRRDMPEDLVQKLRSALEDMNRAGARDPIIARYIGM